MPESYESDLAWLHPAQALKIILSRTSPYLHAGSDFGEMRSLLAALQIVSFFGMEA